MKVSSSQPGGEQYLALQALARQTGQGFEQLSVLYALEGFLRRLASSDDRESFVLKGGVLLAAFDARRPTRDADFLALDLNNDRMIIETKIASIANIDAADGLVLDISSVSSQVIRDEGEYSGNGFQCYFGMGGNPGWSLVYGSWRLRYDAHGHGPSAFVILSLPSAGTTPHSFSLM